MADQPPITPAALPQIPDWVIECLRNQAAGLTYEASLYGPINALLHTIFSPIRNFMVKPQPILQKKLEIIVDEKENDVENILQGLENENVDDEIAAQLDNPDVSRDSYAGRSGKIQFIPDFVVVKATGNITGDKLLFIIEVKRDADPSDSSSFQIAQYLQRAMAYDGSISARLLLFLVLQQNVRVFEIDHPTQRPRQVSQYTIDDPRWIADLHDIATMHWNGAVLRPVD